MLNLSLFGFVLLFLGDITQYVFPLNKNLWSSSFTLFLAGISSLALGFFVFICDLKQWGKHLTFAQIFGVNSIFTYALAGILTTIFYSDRIWGFKFNDIFMEGLTAVGVAPKLASLLYALLYAGIIWLPAKYLYNKKIYIKL